jgi:NADH-quinone oxidoreductase subunit M
VIGILLLGPVNNKHYLEFKDATWFERVSTITLTASVAAIGLAPLWLSELITGSLKPFVDKLAAAF